ncbi:hypothetical protein ACTD5D_22720 [Nocardia takedensis]|uniref:hypothetical protein n=1 Tax=Nocardia takedensis TaxID=259390 RepID=UPI003F77648F
MYIAPTRLASIIYLRTAASNLIEAAATLHESGVASAPDFDTVLDQICELDNAGDRLLQELLDTLPTDSLPAGERADLSGVLGTVLDHMETTDVHAHIHSLPWVPPETIALMDIVTACAEALTESLPEFDDPRRPLHLTLTLRRLAAAAERAVTNAAIHAIEESRSLTAGIGEVNQHLLAIVHAFYRVGHAAVIGTSTAGFQ